MARIYDYNSFQDGNKGANPNDFKFGDEIKYINIDIHNRPEEYEDITDAKAYVEYSTRFIFKKGGIDDIIFSVDSVELEFEVDDYPNDESKEFDIDLIPGKTIDYSQLKAEREEVIIPSYPDRIEINMNKSTEPRNFEVTVYFGSSARY